MAAAIKKILLKKGTNAAGKSGFGLIFDGRDNCFTSILRVVILIDSYMNILFYWIIVALMYRDVSFVIVLPCLPVRCCSFGYSKFVHLK